VRPSKPTSAECPKYEYTPSNPAAFATATYTLFIHAIALATSTC
jgi:hypothetical protein